MGLQEFAGPRSPGSHHLFPLFLANTALPGRSWRSLQPLCFEAGLKRIEGPYSNLLTDPNNPEGECLAGVRHRFILLAYFGLSVTLYEESYCVNF